MDVGVGNGVEVGLVAMQKALDKRDTLKEKIVNFSGGQNSPEAKALQYSLKQQDRHIDKLGVQNNF